MKTHEARLVIKSKGKGSWPQNIQSVSADCIYNIRRDVQPEDGTNGSKHGEESRNSKHQNEEDRCSKARLDLFHVDETDSIVQCSLRSPFAF